MEAPATEQPAHNASASDAGGPVQPQPEVHTKSNLPIILVVVLIVAALLLGGYIVMSGQGGSHDQYSATPTQAPTASSDLEEDLNALDVESNNSDFEDVDKDLQSL